MHDEALKDDILIQNLTDAGLCGEEIEQFLTCYKQDKKVAQMQILNQYRGKLLDTVWDSQEKLYCLDYLIRKLRIKN